MANVFIYFISDIFWTQCWGVTIASMWPTFDGDHFVISLCLNELKGPMISVNDYLLPKNLMLPSSIGLYNGAHAFIIGGMFLDYIWECPTMIGH